MSEGARAVSRWARPIRWSWKGLRSLSAAIVEDADISR